MYVSIRMFLFVAGIVAFLTGCGTPEFSSPEQGNSNKSTTTGPTSQHTQPSQNTQPTHKACWTAADCGVGHLCEQGKCVIQPKNSGCRTDNDCDAGKRCVEQTCQQDMPCSQKTEICNGIDDNCDGIADEGAVCGTGESCIQGKCQKAPTPPTPPTPSSCRTDAECRPGESCQQSICQKSPTSGCRNHADCASNETCVNGTCQKSPTSGCRTDTDCASNETCSNHTCIKKPSGSCQSDRDCQAGQICGHGICLDRPKEICNGVDDNADGQIDETGCSGVCKFPLELKFTGHESSVYLKLNEDNGSCDPLSNSSALVFGNSHAGRYVGNAGRWTMISTSHGKLYNGSVLMDFPFGQRVTLGIKSPKGRAFSVLFEWSGSVQIISIQ